MKLRRLVLPAIASLALVAAFATASRASDAASASGERPTTEFQTEWFYYGDKPERWRKVRPELEKLVGKQAPGFDVQRWVGGEHDIEELRGEIVVLDFWGTWCRPCIRAIPHLNEVAETYEKRGVTVLGVCDGARRAEKMDATIEEHDVRYPTALDKGKSTFKAYNGQWYPFIVLVDREGVVRAAGLRPSALERALNELLEEQPKAEDG